MHAPDAVRPLPPQPNLEFERKEAKKLLRRLRAGDVDARKRARDAYPDITDDAARIQLADAQLVIAREYGFASWPKLTHYFSGAERVRRRARPYLAHSRQQYESEVQRLLSDQAWFRGRMLAAYVPRFFGVDAEAVQRQPISEHEARLAVARMRGFESWDALARRCEQDTERRARIDAGGERIYTAALAAMRAADLAALQEVVANDPSLLEPKDDESGRRGTLLHLALGVEEQLGVAGMQPIMDWLVEQGFDLQRSLHVRLCGTWPGDQRQMKTHIVRSLLDRGCDANWVAPNGIPVLEHALLLYWNGEAVDLLASRARRPDGLWIAAGLGDVAGVAGYLDRSGAPTPSAYRSRPDADAIGGPWLPAHPEPSAEELLVEAFFVAMINQRVEVMNYMISRGFPVDSVVFGEPLIKIAVGNIMPEAVECLVRGRANLDLRGHESSSARDMAREWYRQAPGDERRRHIAERCGAA